MNVMPIRLPLLIEIMLATIFINKPFINKQVSFFPTVIFVYLVIFISKVAVSSNSTTTVAIPLESH